MRKNIWGLWVVLVCTGIVGCKDQEEKYDASGMFEAQEVIVSSEISGRIEKLDVREGDLIEAGKLVGNIDTMQIYWLKMQAKQAVKAIDSRIPDLDKVLETYRLQVARGKREQARVERLLKGGAATQKMYDDVKSEVEVGSSMLSGQTHQLEATIAGAREESAVYSLKIEQANDQIRRCMIVNPVRGTVLAKYTQEKELAAPIKALYKIGDLENMYLRVYLENSKMTNIKVGDPVTVFVHSGEDQKRELTGTVSWISNEAEFVPKVAQTQNERENLVYAVKIHVKNDGSLRIGTYANIKL